jgi:hypothetical protein
MLGFQAIARGAARIAIRTSMPKMSTYMPKQISWIHQYLLRMIR